MSEPLSVIPDILPAPTPIAETNGSPPPLEFPEHLKPRHDEGVYTQWGLRSPDGVIHWDKFNDDVDLKTPESRAVLRLRLRATARDLGFEPEAFVAQYGWVGRVVTQTTERTFADAGSVPIDTDEVAPLPGQQPPQ